MENLKRIEQMTMEEMKKELLDFETRYYDQNENTVFISYSHKDCKTIYPKVLEWMRMGYNIFVDVDFENHGSDDDWVEQMAKQIRSNTCVMAICFKSENYYFSYPALIEVLTMRSERTIRKRKSAINECIPIDVIEIEPSPCREGKEFSSDCVIQSYEEYYSRLQKENSTFLKNHPKEREKLREGLDTLLKKCEPSDKIGDSVEELLKDLDDAFTGGIKNFFPEVANLMSIWLLKNELNGNVKKINSSGVLTRFSELSVYKVERNDVNTNILEEKNDEENTANLTELEDKPMDSLISTIIETVDNNDEIQEQKKSNVNMIYSDSQCCDSATINITSPKHNNRNIKRTVYSGSKPIGCDIKSTTTIEEFRRMLLSREYCLWIRGLREDKATYAIPKQIFDYVMASILNGCDKKVEKDSYRWNYCVYAVQNSFDEKNPKLESGQFTWQSNARKAVNIPRSGKLGEYSNRFEQISPALTLGELMHKYIDADDAEFKTKNNEAAIKTINILVEN